MKFNFNEDFSDIYNCEKLVDINIKGIEYCRNAHSFVGILTKQYYIINLSNSSFHGVINIGSGVGYSYIESIKFIEEELDIQAKVVNKNRTKSKIDKIFKPVLLSKVLPNLKFTSLKIALGMMSNYQK